MFLRDFRLFLFSNCSAPHWDRGSSLPPNNHKKNVYCVLKLQVKEDQQDAFASFGRKQHFFARIWLYEPGSKLLVLGMVIPPLMTESFKWVYKPLLLG